MRLALEGRVAFRCPPELELRLYQLADLAGYSKPKIIRKLFYGALLRLESQAESKHGLVLALNRFARMK
jgi:hypothetical protein